MTTSLITYSYHNGHNEHGVFYYDLKPAIKLQKIIDAIETKYGIEFQSNFFDRADFGKLFMWCHRRAGYMFKDQPLSVEWRINTIGRLEGVRIGTIRYIDLM